MKQKQLWTFETVHKEALNYTTRSEFSKDSPSAYQTAYKNGWLDKVCSHMPKPKQWTFEDIHQEASLYTTRSAFSKGSRGAYQKAYKEGWLDKVCSHMVAAPIGVPTKWTFESTHKEALNYTTRSDFQRGSGGAYQKAYKNSWLDKVCSHMGAPRRGAPTKWTFEAVQQEASLYPTRSVFQKKSPSAYSAARKNGWLDEVCPYETAVESNNSN